MFQKATTNEEVILMLITAYPNTRVHPNTVELYVDALRNIPTNLLQAVVARCIRTNKFLPTIAEILDHADELIDKVNNKRDKDSDEAWAEVMKQMHDAFVYEKPVFSTPEIERAALSMGWVSLCETPTDLIGVARAQFIRIYESVIKRKRENKIDRAILGGELKNMIDHIADHKSLDCREGAKQT